MISQFAILNCPTKKKNRLTEKMLYNERQRERECVLPSGYHLTATTALNRTTPFPGHDLLTMMVMVVLVPMLSYRLPNGSTCPVPI